MTELGLAIGVVAAGMAVAAPGIVVIPGCWFEVIGLGMGMDMDMGMGVPAEVEPPQAVIATGAAEQVVAVRAWCFIILPPPPQCLPPPRPVVAERATIKIIECMDRNPFPATKVLKSTRSPAERFRDGCRRLRRTSTRRERRSLRGGPPVERSNCRVRRFGSSTQVPGVDAIGVDGGELAGPVGFAAEWFALTGRTSGS